MITETQCTEIRQYLTTKNLPLDVIIEVEDHFVSQIENIEFKKNNTFQQAFYKTKLLWVKDFEMVRKSFISFKKVPRIVRELQMTELKSFVKKALIATFAFSILSFIIARFISNVNFNHFLLFSRSLIFLPTICLLVYYLFSSQNKPLVRAEIYYYNQILIIFGSSIIFAFAKVLMKIPDVSMYAIYNNFTHIMQSFNTLSIVFNIVEDILTNAIGIYFLLFLVYRLKAMNQIKKFQIGK